MENPNPSAKDRVLAKIREGRIAMRSKLSFTFEAFLAGFVALVILAVSVAIVSFILFGLRVNGHESLLSFGPRGVGAFFAIFPWPLLVLDVLLVLFLETLLRRFKFGYRSPMLYLLFGVAVVAIAAGLALDRGTPFNDNLLDRADHGGLPPPFGEIYEHVRATAPHDHGIYRGVVIGVAASSLTVRSDDRTGATSSTYTVMLPPRIATSSLQVGDRVYVAGDADDGVIRAFGIRVLIRPETSSSTHP